MNEEDKRWVANIHEKYISVPNTIERYCLMEVLYCSHWASLVYLHCSAQNHKVILSSPIHTVCSIDGILIDVEFNAYIEDWGWNKAGIDPNIYLESITKPINSRFRIQEEQIMKFYAEKANKSFHIWNNKVF